MSRVTRVTPPWVCAQEGFFLPAKILPPALLQDARQHGWGAIASSSRKKKSISCRVYRLNVPATFLCGPVRRATLERMCELVVMLCKSWKGRSPSEVVQSTCDSCQ